jgi:hypothetical protein
MRPFAVVLALLLLGALPALSEAGTVGLDRFQDPTYRAGAGETNSLTVSLGPTTPTPQGDRVDVSLTDSTAPIVAGRGCQHPSADTATCPLDYGNVLVHLGDGNDSALLNVEEHYAEVRAGVGNDRVTVAASESELRGGPGDDILFGGEGIDQLRGGGGRDEIHGRGGDDDISDGDHPGAVDADVLDGGGEGCLDYSSRTSPLRVDLSDSGVDGERGEGDQVSGFTRLAGGRADDVFVGTGAAEEFVGGGGADYINARGGNDYVALIGREHVVGGPGRDLVAYATGLGGGSSGCGYAADRFRFPGSWLSSSCERLLLVEGSDCGDQLVVRPRPLSASRSGRLVFRVPCADEGYCREVRSRVMLTTGHPPFRPLTDKRFLIRHRSRAVAVQLPSRLARRARHQAVRLRLRLSGPDGCGSHWSTAWRFDIGPRASGAQVGLRE